MQKLFVGFAFLIFLKELIKSTTNILTVFFLNPAIKILKITKIKANFMKISIIQHISRKTIKTNKSDKTKVFASKKKPTRSYETESNDTKQRNKVHKIKSEVSKAATKITAQSAYYGTMLATNQAK